MEALEVTKIILGIPGTSHKSLTLFDGLNLKFHKVKLRSRHHDCAVCGLHPTITQLIDYEAFCNAPACDQIQSVSILPSSSRVSIEDYARKVMKSPHVLIDCRPKHEYDICHLVNSVSIPLKEISVISEEEILKRIGNDSKNVFVICHRGNLSQYAVSALRDKFRDSPGWMFYDIAEGLDGWANKIDPAFPCY